MKMTDIHQNMLPSLNSVFFVVQQSIGMGNFLLALPQEAAERRYTAVVNIRDVPYVRLSGSPPSAEQVQGMSLSALRMVRDRLESRSAKLDAGFASDERARARTAISDAMRMLNRIGDLPGLWCDINDEGVVILQWRKNSRTGVLLIFQGDGAYTLSHKQLNSNYSAKLIEMKLSDRLTPIRQLIADL